MANLHLTQEKLDALRSEYKPRTPCALLKYPRPKTKPEYQYIYPWLLPDETDPHFVFCTVCECRLSAKRSDLGKHEGSIKHSENAQRKGLQPKAEPATVPEMKWEYDDEDAMLVYGPVNGINEMCKQELLDDDEADEDDEEDDDEAGGDGEVETEVDYEPTCKRRVSETDSQHSGMLDFLPLQVTINEMPSVQLLPQYQPSATAPQPCRITIKKVTAPLSKAATTSTTVAATNTVQPHEITTKATITPIAAGNATGYSHAQRQQQQHSYSAKQLQSYQLQSPNPIAPLRDSFDLFFDSICATVKSLPPKLATEGKIRVMQLVGELELRAIIEREAQPALQQNNVNVNAMASLAAVTIATDLPGSSSSASQQNATVASTTK